MLGTAPESGLRCRDFHSCPARTLRLQQGSVADCRVLTGFRSGYKDFIFVCEINVSCDLKYRDFSLLSFLEAVKSLCRIGDASLSTNAVSYDGEEEKEKFSVYV